MSIKLNQSEKSDVVDWLVAIVAIVWVVMQWWWASPISFSLGQYIPLLHLDEQKFSHLCLAIALGALAMVRALKSRYSIWQAILSILAVAVLASPCLYLLVESDALAERAGANTTTDIAFGVFGLTVLLLFTYIALSRGLVILSIIAIIYLLWGDQWFIPDAAQWKGASLEKTISHLWLYTEGVFGISIGVATQFIFLFVLFGEILQRMGFGQFITSLSMQLLAQHKAGGAKAAILSSTAIGSISGSSTANVVTTGNFTIPLMMKNGLSREEAGAVEVAASSNGQLMPPIMGAAAFLIAEYTNTPYSELIFHAFLPAACAFFGLLCIVHLRACAQDGLQYIRVEKQGRSRYIARLSELYRQRSLWKLLARGAVLILALMVLYSLRQTMPSNAFFLLAAAIVAIVYVYLTHRNAGVELKPDEFQSLGEIWRSGVHFGLPILVLLWLLIVEGLSPQLSVWWAVVSALLMLLTRPALCRWFTTGDFFNFLNYYRKHNLGTLMLSLSETTVKRMLPISLATACAGIIVGTITLSGLQQILGDIVLFAAGDSLILLLVLLALSSLLLGLGLPTTPNYILISSLFAVVLYTATEQYGLSVSLIAIHLFILYFGVLADDTPPVGLCAYAASAISGGNPIQTGVRAFLFDIRTAILPFAFIFNPDLLLINLGLAEGLMVVIVSLAAMYVFSAALQSWFIVRNSVIEGIMLILASSILLCPQWLHGHLFPPWKSQAQATLFMDSCVNEPRIVRLRFGESEVDQAKTLSFDAIPEISCLGVLRETLGISIDEKGLVTEVELFSLADDLEITPGWQLENVEVEQDNDFSPRWMWLVSVILIAIVAWRQRRRKNALIGNVSAHPSGMPIR